MRRIVSAGRMALGLVVVVSGLGGCKGKPGAHPKPGDAIDACRKALDATPEKPKPTDVRRAASACSALFSEPTCRRAFAGLEVGSIRSWTAAESTCLCAYCSKVARRDLAYCKRYCPAQKRRSPEATVAALGPARELWEEVRHYEYGTRCGDHQQANELLGRLFALSMRIGWSLDEPPAGDPPALEPVRPTKKRPALDLALVITDKGFYLKSRHGSECPEGVSDEAKLCFPKKDGKYTDSVLKQLQHHLWYLFASKYRDPDSYGSPDERHRLTVIPEPTIEYETIVRTLDVIRDIPRDAKNPPVKHAIPAGGCSMQIDPKTKRWGFVQVGGRSVRDTACMYYRVTFALGSS